MKKQYLECGKIVTTHGILGEVKLQPWCNSPEEILQIKTLFLDEGKTPLTIKKARVHKNMLLLLLDGYDSVERSQTLRGKIVFAHRDAFTLEQGENFIQDLIGCAVVDVDTGKHYGTLSDVTETGANDVYHIAFEDGTTRLIPVIEQVIINTDIDKNIIEIRPLKGLFDDED